MNVLFNILMAMISLNLDVWRLILAKLNQRQMVKVKRVCKEWHDIVKNEIELNMPMVSLKYIIVNALHIYLGAIRGLEKLQEKYSPWLKKRRIKWFKWACKSGDEDLIIRWIRPHLRRDNIANIELAYSGREDLLKKMGIAYNQYFLSIGYVKKGNLEKYRLCGEDCAYEALRCAVKKGHIEIAYYILDTQNLNFLRYTLMYLFGCKKWFEALKYIAHYNIRFSDLGGRYRVRCRYPNGTIGDFPIYFDEDTYTYVHKLIKDFWG